MLIPLSLLVCFRIAVSWRYEDRKSGMYKDGHTKIHWFSEGSDMFVTLRDTNTLYCFLEVYTKGSSERRYRKLSSHAGTIAERDIETLSLVNRHLSKLCQGSILLTSENDWEYVTNGADRIRRLVGGSKLTKKKKKTGRNKRRKKSAKKCPARRTPHCSVLHDFHKKHILYHNVNDKHLLDQVNKKSCRCRHNTGTRIPCGSKICYMNGIHQPCGPKYCNNVIFDFCAESRTECDPEKLLDDYVVKSMGRGYL